VLLHGRSRGYFFCFLGSFISLFVNQMTDIIDAWYNSQNNMYKRILPHYTCTTIFQNVDVRLFGGLFPPLAIVNFQKKQFRFFSFLGGEKKAESKLDVSRLYNIYTHVKTRISLHTRSGMLNALIRSPRHNTRYIS
jgi:hypothetical protein